MLAPLDIHELLRGRLSDALDSVTLTAPGGLVSLALDLPLLPDIAPEIRGPRFGFNHGRRGQLWAGYGIAAEWRAQGAGRLRLLGQTARALAPRWEQLDPDRTGLGGFAFLGFAADPLWASPDDGETGTPAGLPNSLLWVPEMAVVRHSDRAALIFTARLPAPRGQVSRRWLAWLWRLAAALARPAPGPRAPIPLQSLESLPARGQWRDLVESTLGLIRDGGLKKAVLSRRVWLRGPRRFDLARLEAELRNRFPDCQAIRISRGTASFVAATPERLLSVRRGRVATDAIAGSASRSPDPNRDAALRAALIASDKERHEHALVVEAMRGALGPCCTELRAPTHPKVLRLENAQHLWTPLAGRLSGGRDIFDLAELLHPTPATNGEPRQVARDWLRRAEPDPRGWYTGAAGIVQPSLSGELWVLLRCAEIRGDRARLYAGAGIVDGSDPLAEWQETDHKLSAMATALRFA
jgi:salicylate biosynthesis isochorismate synthase